MRVVQLESFLDGAEVIVEGRGSRQRGGVLGNENIIALGR